MRKFFAMLLAAVLCLSLAACGGNGGEQEVTVDAAAMFKALLNDVTYSGDATEFEASETNVAMILGGTLPEGTEAYLAANNSSYLRCAVFACKDKDAAAAVKALIQS